MKQKNITLFLLGFFTATALLYGLSYSTTEVPFVTGATITNTETKTPKDHITRNDIKITNEEIIIKIKDASISTYAATKSMEPLINEHTNGIRIIPTNEEEINEGDLISFKQEGITKIHRIIEKGVDSEGTYYITKGDNTEQTDKKIRYEQITHKTIGILW